MAGAGRDLGEKIRASQRGSVAIGAREWTTPSPCMAFSGLADFCPRSLTTSGHRLEDRGQVTMQGPQSHSSQDHNSPYPRGSRCYRGTAQAEEGLIERRPSGCYCVDSPELAAYSAVRTACSIARRTAATVTGFVSRGTWCTAKKVWTSGLRVSPVRIIVRWQRWGCCCANAW